MVVDFSELAESVTDFFDWTDQDGWAGDTARGLAASLRGECLTVRLPGIPFGEQIARGADWWGRQVNSFFSEEIHEIRAEHERVTCEIQLWTGLGRREDCEDDFRPRFRGRGGVPTEDFLVSVPAWQDIFVYENERVFDARSRAQRAADYSESLQRSPTPLSIRETAELLTTLDDLQDEAATLSVGLRLVEWAAGRAIPGVGQVRLVADALNVAQTVGGLATGLRLPGKRSKRILTGKGKASSNGFGADSVEVRRLGRVRGVVGTVLEGLQATESVFGTGIQIGSVMGFLNDAFWGAVRGAEFRFRGPVTDPFGFSEAGRAACYRSPTLDVIHPDAHRILSLEALRLWSKAGRVMPFIDILGEHALASVLVGMRLAEGLLGPWLRSGAWVEPLVRAVEIRERVPGGSLELETRQLRADEWVRRTAPATVAATARAISAVRDRGRQSFYESLVSSIGWGLLGSLDPGAVVRGPHMMGPLLDAFFLADAGRLPVSDLGD